MVSSCIGLCSTALHAQDADVIRGRVTGEAGQPVARATISAVALSGGVARTATTDAEGRYAITFANGDGDYWISVSAVGYVLRRFEIKRLADQQVLVGDVRLQRLTTTLDTVQVASQQRQRATRDTTKSDIGGTEFRPITEVTSVDQLNDLALLAGTIPGVQIVANENGPSGYSVLGLSQDQNQTTLNGMRFGGSALPRDAAFDASLAISPYDVSRGGFSGAQLALRSRPPTNLTLRANSLAVDAPTLQWTDPAARALGQEFSNLSLGGVVTTPLERDRAFLHIAYQGAQRFSDLRTILDADAATLNTVGIANDSLLRLRSIMNSLGVPQTVDAVPSMRIGRQGLLYGALDFTSPTASSGRTLNVMYTGSWNQQAPVALGATSFPAHAGTRNSWQGGVQLRHTGSFGFGILSETQASASGSRTTGARYLNLPSALVRIVSDLDDGDRGVKNIALGGSPALDREQTTTLLAVNNQMSWFSRNNRHRLKLSTELSRESLDEQLASNTLGMFQFNSLQDLEAGRPASFQRQLASPRHDFANYRGGVALSDGFAPVPTLQLLYGVRLDVNRFDSRPVRNPAIESAFGIRNDHAPNRIDASPRIGFAWSYGTAAQVAAVQGAARAPRAVVRGGIGVFQGVPSPTSLVAVSDNTGLPNAARQLVCTGPSTPSANWSSYITDLATVPVTCADGAGAQPFISANPAIVLYDRGFSSPRSVRSNLQWTGNILDNRFQLQADLTGSINLAQPGYIDRNFRDDVQFTLSGEAGRPVYVPVAGVDAATGAVASARKVDAFSTVTELRSDLRSTARQFTIALAPVGVRSNFRWNVAYVNASIRDESPGFSNTAGNPLAMERGRSAFDSRHQIVYSIGYNLLDLLRVSWSGSLRSGQPYTPLVNGDINGDGRSNDRAYVPDPSINAGPEVDAVAELMQRGSRSARECLRKQIGSIATRNSCEGPWSSFASLNIALNPVRWWRSNRLDVALQVSNPLGAADMLMHGVNNLRGWGQPAQVDPDLYYVKGFDASRRAFLYDVNARFGDASPAANASRAPVVVTAIVRYDFGPTREKQSLDVQLDRGRSGRGTRMSEAELASVFINGGVFNPFTAILRNADTLQLTPQQADSLTVLSGMYSRRVAVIWAPIVKQLAALSDDYKQRDAYSTYLSGRRRTIDLLARVAPDVLGLLTPTQRRALPVEVQSHLNVKYLATIRSGTAGLGLAFLPGISAPTGSSSVGGRVLTGPSR